MANPPGFDPDACRQFAKRHHPDRVDDNDADRVLVYFDDNVAQGTGILDAREMMYLWLRVAEIERMPEPSSLAP